MVYVHAKRQNQILLSVGGSLFVTLVALPTWFVYWIDYNRTKLAQSQPKPPEIDFPRLVYERRLEARRLLAEDKARGQRP